jgi:hypothetical protein
MADSDGAKITDVVFCGVHIITLPDTPSKAKPVRIGPDLCQILITSINWL